jgi:hypothetical protein
MYFSARIAGNSIDLQYGLSFITRFCKILQITDNFLFVSFFPSNLTNDENRFLKINFKKHKTNLNVRLLQNFVQLLKVVDVN